MARGATNGTRFGFQGNLCAAAGTKSCDAVNLANFYVLLMNTEIQGFEAGEVCIQFAPNRIIRILPPFNGYRKTHLRECVRTGHPVPDTSYGGD